ncbi:hypothetical protein DEH18_28780 [Streptomyces sp. NHF165]|uniref:hypothetical protein n=1 Tax=Streptomyces sp. NHF165 TaxID=2175864 RepID=UPI00132F1325|nr:hypothetical protein [Streptomyces sp. NHF165]QHF97177.1 hypothetical protein DEH18_28780 [Streptomyces sp. NHF165]
MAATTDAEGLRGAAAADGSDSAHRSAAADAAGDGAGRTAGDGPRDPAGSAEGDAGRGAGQGADGSTAGRAAEDGADLGTGSGSGSGSGTEPGSGAGGGGRLRAWTVGWATGLAQAVGAAVLLVTELVRDDVGGPGARLPDGVELPGYAAGFPELVSRLQDQFWFRAAGEVRDALGLGEPRAALWAAVCAALVVRLNRYGPPRTQCFLSVAGAVYCVPSALAAVPQLALAGWALPFAFLLGALAVATPALLYAALDRRRSADEAGPEPG